jgi:ubiquinone/menaquinone biosynthesis C-methylase UbiE
MFKPHKIKVNYEHLAPGYDERYSLPAEEEARGKALLTLAAQDKARRILEVGCGTGHWLKGLAGLAVDRYGLDLSEGMLRKAAANDPQIHLARGSAIDLPYAENCFDLVYCVDAIHHFGDAYRFIEQAYRVLRTGGRIAIFGNDPHSGDVSWYGYDYFDSTRETDLKRFTPHSVLIKWMREAGFSKVEAQTIESLGEVKRGRQVYDDPFLKKTATSQFALLSDEAWQAGLERIQSAIVLAEKEGREIVFESCWPVKMLTGSK